MQSHFYWTPIFVYYANEKIKNKNTNPAKNRPRVQDLQLLKRNQI
jgi:hypothetical protein